MPARIAGAPSRVDSAERNPRRPLRLLVLSSLYPSAARPRHGIFIEQRLRHLIDTGEVEARVIAPTPWFPFAGETFGRYGVHARVARRERRHGIEITYPRYPLIPKVGMNLAPLLMARALAPVLGRIFDEGYDFDILDAYYFYPDGVAATMLGRRFAKPTVITALGSDLNVIARHRMPRRRIVAAAREAAGLTTVCRALKEVLVAMGIPEERVAVVIHGVDHDLFRPIDRVSARAELGMTHRCLLSVGNLVPLKGHDLVIAALPRLPGVHLHIVGEGEEEATLRRLAATLGVSDRVRFVGHVPHESMRRYMGAADALVLASSREGMANVLLEAMACGTPVVATAVGGTPEAVSSPAAGVLMRERTPEALAEAVDALFAAYPDHAATRRHAETFDWARTSRDHLAVLNQALARYRGTAPQG